MRDHSSRCKNGLCAYAFGFFTGILIGLFSLWESTFLMALGTLFITTSTILFINMKYDAAVFLNIVLLSIAVFEPFPGEVFFVLILFFGLVNKKIDFKKLREEPFLIILLLFFIIVNLLGLYNVLEPLWGIRYFTITLYLFVLMLFIFLYLNGKRYYSILRAYVVSALFSGVVGFLGYIGVSALFMYDQYRIKGLFKDPNVFGPFLVPAFMILMDDLKSRKILGKYGSIYLTSMAFLLFGILFSFSRASWINLIVCILVYFSLNIKKLHLKKLIPILVILSILIVTIWFVIFDESLRTFFTYRSSLQSYDSGRFETQRLGLALSMERPFGYGPGQFEFVLLNKMGVLFSSHNLYIRLLVEHGIIGFMLFMLPLVYILMELLNMHLHRIDRDQTKYSLILAILSGILINSLVIDTIHWRHFWFFIATGLWMIHSYKYKFTERWFPWK